MEKIAELKQIYKSLSDLKQKLYDIKLFYKGFGLKRTQYYEFENIAEKFIAISKKLKRTNSSDLVYYLINLKEKAEKIVKYLEYHKQNTEESKNYFNWIKESISEINRICLFF